MFTYIEKYRCVGRADVCTCIRKRKEGRGEGEWKYRIKSLVLSYTVVV